MDSYKRPTPNLKIDISVPIMTNTKKINIGDVLQYYDAEKRDSHQKDVKDSEARPGKRLKTNSAQYLIA